MKKIVAGILAISLVFGAVVPVGNGVFNVKKGITASAEEKESFNSAVPIGCNEYKRDAILDRNDEHYYTFTLPSNGKINLSFGRDYSDKGEGWCVEIFNQYQEKLEEQYFGKGTSKTEYMPSLGLSKGKYFIKVYPYSKYNLTNADYTVNVNFKSNSQWESEKNDSFDTSDNIVLGKTFYGATTGNDTDIFKVNVPKSGYYNFSFGKKYSDKGEGWNLYVYNNVQEEIYKQYFEKGNSKTETTKFRLSAGTNYIKIEPYSRYNATTTDYHFCLSNRINYCRLSGIRSSYTYNGKYIRPSVRLTNGSYVLKNGKDYTVSYKNNKNAGVASVIIRGKGIYNGTIVKNFVIKPKANSIAAVSSPRKATIKVRWKKNSQASGYQIAVSTNKKFRKARYVTVKGGNISSAIIDRLSRGKKYYVKIRAYKSVNGKKYYSSFSKVKAIRTRR